MPQATASGLKVRSEYRWVDDLSTQLFRSTNSYQQVDLNSNMYVREVLLPVVVPVLQGIPGTIFQQVNLLQRLFDTFVPSDTWNCFLGLLNLRIRAM
ncbi:hypothetical protein TNCV_2800091 [Trichonephila clavipes]|nr:hypothetical protein TNCV_2800091 [Trichonephila clavipes]